MDAYDEIVGLLARGHKAACATLVVRRGSAPGAPGAEMLVREDGTTLGSVGGGCVEAEVWQAGMNVFATGMAEMPSFRLSGEEAAESGLICGGTVELLVELADERLGFVHAPIGLPIGARLPEEIAVSIVAELISVRNAMAGGIREES